MSEAEQPRPLEVWLSRLMNAGVLAAAGVALLGGAMDLRRHGGEAPALHEFRGEVSGLTSPGAVFAGVAGLEPRALMQLAVLILIATPVLRVAAAGVIFAVQRDRLYVVVSLLVLAGLAVGLAGWIG